VVEAQSLRPRVIKSGMARSRTAAIKSAKGIILGVSCRMIADDDPGGAPSPLCGVLFHGPLGSLIFHR
jgi:hypothetical protein